MRKKKILLLLQPIQKGRTKLPRELCGFPFVFCSVFSLQFHPSVSSAGQYPKGTTRSFMDEWQKLELLVALKPELSSSPFCRHGISCPVMTICQICCPSLHKATPFLMRPAIKNVLMPQLIQWETEPSLGEPCTACTLEKEAVTINKNTVPWWTVLFTPPHSPERSWHCAATATVR